MLIIENLEIIKNQSAAPYNWVLIRVNELSELYYFEVVMDSHPYRFYLNRESQYMSGRMAPVYRLYKSFPQSSVNRWLSISQIKPHIIKRMIHKMLNE